MQSYLRNYGYEKIVKKQEGRNKKGAMKTT